VFFARALTACNTDEGLSFKLNVKSRLAFYTPLQYNMVLFEIKRPEIGREVKRNALHLPQFFRLLAERNFIEYYGIQEDLL
jgi:hypothetical protein